MKPTRRNATRSREHMLEREVLLRPPHRLEMYAHEQRGVHVYLGTLTARVLRDGRSLTVCEPSSSASTQRSVH